MDKPILCNACGARYLVKKNLDGYLPGQQHKKPRAKPAGAVKKFMKLSSKLARSSRCAPHARQPAGPSTSRAGQSEPILTAYAPGAQ